MSDTTKQDKSSEPNKSTSQPADLMGYEGQIPTAEETTLPATSTATDVQATINKAVKEVTVGEDGKYVYPEDMDPMLKAAVAATKSYRDNHSGFTKSQQSLKESEAETEALREQLAEQSKKPLELTTEDQAELDKLYIANPEAWRARVNKLEAEAAQTAQDAIDDVTSGVRTKAGAEHELARRVAYLEAFNVGRKTSITEDTLDNDIPPRINNKLAKGEVTFEEYLSEVSSYLDKGKVVGGATPQETTDLNRSNGASTSGIKEDGAIDYASQTL